jgi:hypothetical protein
MARKTRRLRGGRGYTTGAGAELKQMSMAPVMGGGKKRYNNKSIKRILNKKNKERESKRIENESARIYNQQEKFYEFLASPKQLNPQAKSFISKSLNPHAKLFVPSK